MDARLQQEKLRQETGVDAEFINFLPFSDLEQSVRDDVQRIKASPFFPPNASVRGFVYDVQTGRLTEVTSQT